MLHAVTATRRWIEPEPGTVPATAILIVDDDPGVRGILSAWCHDAGYEVRVASSSAEALRRLDEADVAVAICDILMPGHDGLWLADRIRQAHPATAVVMATGLHDLGPAVASLRHGVVDYLTKPFSRDRLADAVSRAMQWHASAVEARRREDSLGREIEARRLRITDSIAALQVDSPAKVDALLALLTCRQDEAYAHAHRVAAVAVRLARVLGVDETGIAAIEGGALLHDIGRQALLETAAPHPLTSADTDGRLLRLHPALGAGLIEHVPYLAAAAAIVRDAHERIDGLGFPNGRKGPAVALGARIVAVADAYDALTRGGRGVTCPSPEAVDEIARSAGTQYDAEVVGALRQVVAAR